MIVSFMNYLEVYIDSKSKTSWALRRLALYAKSTNVVCGVELQTIWINERTPIIYKRVLRRALCAITVGVPKTVRVDSQRRLETQFILQDIAGEALNTASSCLVVLSTKWIDSCAASTSHNVSIDAFNTDVSIHLRAVGNSRC